MNLEPYLFFTNTCRDAMTTYQQIFGGQLDMMTVGDMPPGAEPPPGEPNPDMVIHAALLLDDGRMLMASDDPTGDARGMVGAALSVAFDEAADVARVFDALADGGSIDMPLGETFWSPQFGMCTDRFGTKWMVSITGAASSSEQEG